MVEIGVKLKKVVIFTVKGCYRSVCNHLFLVGMLCLLMLMYRSFPFLFSILVSASPVLVCTAALLGTLLSFGQPNIPEIGKEGITTHEIVPLKTGFSRDAVIFERNESCSAERYSEKGTDVVKKPNEETNSVPDGICEIGSGGSFAGSGQHMEERSREMQFGGRVEEEMQRELQGFEYEQKNEMLKVGLSDGKRSAEHQYSLIPDDDDETLEAENDRSPVGSVDSKVVNVDSLDSPPGSPWKHVDEGEEEVDVDDEASDSGSDRAESSSPDASMADILPMLDELHPLLDEETPQPANLSHDGSDTASECSARSNESSNESDEDTETQEESEVADDDNEDGDNEEETQGEKEDQTKSAIMWTEEDQRNLMELGSSELERNQRLENLIARRRARDDCENKQEFEVADDDIEDGEDEEGTQGEKEDQTKSAIVWTEEDQRNLMELGSSELERNRRLENLIARRRARKVMRMMAEKNLIDLESVDLPFNIPPITTTRTNPFDLPQDSYENMGLPPIPGSAPSILLPRGNPFDLPYDSSEEKPDLMGDSFEQEFMPFQSKEPFFRRHESFSIRPSLFGINRPEKRDNKLRPYFIPERMDSEGTSYSPFQRQSSDLSDSKVSSVPDSESLGSAGDPEERSVTEEDISMAEVRNHTEDEVSQEPELISRIEPVPEHIGHGSESSEDEGTLEFGQVEKRHALVDEVEINMRYVESHKETVPSSGADQSLGNSLEANSSEICVNVEAVEQRYGGVSSPSSLSEETKRIYAEKEAEELPNFLDIRDYLEEPSISARLSMQGLHSDKTTALTGHTPHGVPVYDLSPQAATDNLSSSSISSDLRVESEIDLLPVVVKSTVSLGEGESEAKSQEMESDTSVDKEMLASSSKRHQVNKSETESRGNLEITEHNIIPVNRVMSTGSLQIHSVDENEMKSKGVSEITEHDIQKYEFSPVDEISDSVTASVVRETVLEHTAVGAKSPTDTLPKENLMYEDVTSRHSRSSNSDIHVAVPDVVEPVSRPSDEKDLAGLKQAQQSAKIEQVSPLQLDALSPRGQSTADHITEGEALLSEQSIVQLNSDSSHYIEDEMSTPSNDQHPLTEKSVSLSTEELAVSDKSVYEPPSGDHKEGVNQESSNTVVELLQEVTTTGNWNHSAVQELDPEVSQDIDIPTSPKSIKVPCEVCEAQAPTDEKTNEIMEIDEELLSELDTVGDFSAKELGELEDHLEPGPQILSVQHDAKSSCGHEGNSTQAPEARAAVHIENLGAALKETNEYDEGIKCLSEPETAGTSAVEQIDMRQYQQRVVGTTDISSREAPKEKEVDVAENILKHNPDGGGTNSVMPEVEARSLKDIESIFGKAVSISMETEIVVRNPEPSSVEISLERTAKDGEVDKVSSQSYVKIETPNFEEKMFKDLYLDLNQLPKDIAEQIPFTDSVLESVASKDKEGKSQEFDVVESASPDEDMECISELVSGTSAVEQIDTRQYDKRKVNTTDLIWTKASKGKEADIGENIVNHNTDAEKTSSAMPEIEARSVEDMESILRQAVSTSVKTEVVLRNLEPTNVESLSEDNAARCSEDGEISETSSQSMVKMEVPNSREKLVDDFDLDLNQLPEDIVEQIPVSDSVLNAITSEDSEGTTQGLHVSERSSSDDSNVALGQDFSNSAKDVLAKDIPNEVDSSTYMESDVEGTTQHGLVKPDYEAKTREGQDVATLDATSKKEKSSKTSSSSSGSDEE